MSLFITSLNSGSNGNCYYIGNDTEAVLIDAGLSCKETERRMARLGLMMNKVRAVFISHEHTDHIKGLSVLARKYQLPVYITPKTYFGSRLDLPQHLVYSFASTQAVTIGTLTITAFPKFHDAADPYSFLVAQQGIRIGIFTDIGVVCDQLKLHFRQCHAAFLEANYDEEMLDKGPYPYHLKARIKGGKGHLSNKQALELFMDCKPEYMSHLLLAHLSKDNNCPDLAQAMFAASAGNTQVTVASRFNETPVYEICDYKKTVAPIRIFEPVQLSLF